MVLKEKKLIQNTGWLLALQAINILLPFITVPYVTRVFGAEQYGIFSIALNWITYFQLVIEFGFNLSATKKVVEFKEAESLNDLVSSVVFARLGLVAVCFVIVIVLGITSVASGEQLECMLVLFSMLVGIALQLNWLFQGLQDMKLITIATGLARGLSVVLIFLLINNSNQLTLYSFLYSITFMVSGIITHFFAWKRYGIKIGFTSLKRIFYEMQDGMPIFLSSAMGKIIGNVGITVLGACQPSSVVGSYAAIIKVPQMASLMFAPVSQALYPRVNEERMKSRRSAVCLVGKFGIPVVILFAVGLSAMAAMRNPVVELFFGKEYLVCADSLIPLAVWVLLGIVNNFLGVQLLIPFGYQSLYSLLMIIDSIVSLVLNMWLGRALGAIGVASAIAISEAALTLALLFALCLVVKRSSATPVLGARKVRRQRKD